MTKFKIYKLRCTHGMCRVSTPGDGGDQSDS